MAKPKGEELLSLFKEVSLVMGFDRAASQEKNRNRCCVRRFRNAGADLAKQESKMEEEVEHGVNQQTYQWKKGKTGQGEEG